MHDCVVRTVVCLCGQIVDIVSEVYFVGDKLNLIRIPVWNSVLVKNCCLCCVFF